MYSLLKDESILTTKNRYIEILLLCIIILKITSHHTPLPFKIPNSRMWFGVCAIIGLTFIDDVTFYNYKFLSHRKMPHQKMRKKSIYLKKCCLHHKNSEIGQFYFL